MSMNDRTTHVDADDESDWLEHALRAHGLEHRGIYVGDDGFTGRVVAALPRPLALPAWRKPVLALLWVCAGIAAALAIPGLFDDVFRGAVTMFVGHRVGIADIAGALLLMGCGTWAALLYAARAD
jgi:hypothetical protein